MRRNDILARLQELHPDFVTSRARQISFVHGDIFGESGRPIDEVLFPGSGMISLVVDLRDGDRIEAAMVGRYGAVGSTVLFGARAHLNTGFAQLPGTGWILKAADLVALSDRAPEVRDLFFRNEQYTLAQAQQTAACNAVHSVEARLARWLLRARDLHDGRTLPLTQELLAQMIGVRRNAISIVAHALQEAGTIGYSRGQIEILDVEALRATSCECHAAIRARQKQLRG